MAEGKEIVKGVVNKVAGGYIKKIKLILIAIVAVILSMFIILVMLLSMNDAFEAAAEGSSSGTEGTGVMTESTWEWMREYISYVEGGASTIVEGEDGKQYYEVIDNKDGELTVGNGVTLGNNFNEINSIASKYGITKDARDYKEGDLMLKDWIDETQEIIIESKIEDIKEYLPGLQPYQYCALLSQTYQKGDLGDYVSYYGNEILNASLEYGKCSFIYYDDYSPYDTAMSNENIEWGEGYFDNDLARNFLKNWDITLTNDAYEGLRGRRRADYVMFISGWSMVTHDYCPMGTTEGLNTYIKITGQTWDVEFINSQGRMFKVYRQGNFTQAYTTGTWGRTIAKSGCGPSSLSIILSGYGYDLDPVGVAEETGCMAGAWQPMVDYMENKGFETKNLSTNNDILNELKRGAQIIINVVDGYVGDYYYEGHYYTILGINENNQVFVGDPAPTNLSEFTSGWYDISELTGKSIIGSFYKDTTEGIIVTQTGSESAAAGDIPNGYNMIYKASSGKTFRSYIQGVRNGIQQNFSSKIRNQCGVCSAATLLSGYGVSITAEQLYNNYVSRWGNAIREYSNGKTYVSQESYDKSKTISLLKSGTPVIMYTTSSKGTYWTDSVHFMTLVDIKEENGETYVYVLNPAAELYSNPSAYQGWHKIDNMGIIHISYLK